MKIPICLLLVASLFCWNEARPQDENIVKSNNGKTIPTEEKKQTENKTRIENYLNAEAIAKMKTLCPELQNLVDGQIVQYRYFEPRAACFKYGRTGPCGEGMKLYIKEYESIYGQCDCKLHTRMWVYHKERNACYPIFSQGGCSEGHYLDLTKDGLPICSENPCALNGTDYVKFCGTCVQIGKPNTEVCEENFAPDFVPNKRTPECILTYPQKVVTAIGVLPCQPGSALAVHGKCHVKEWDFGKED